MTYEWRMRVVEPDDAEAGDAGAGDAGAGDAGAGAGRLRTLVGLSPAAWALLAARTPGTRLTLGVEVAADGTVSGAVLPVGFAAAARQAGLQLRVEPVADGYEKRHVDFAGVHGVRAQDLALLARTLGLHEGARVLDLGGSTETLRELDAYCRSIVPAALARRLDLTENGDDLQFTVPNHVVAGRKPGGAGA